jgi:hypothetical protein
MGPKPIARYAQEQAYPLLVQKSIQEFPDFLKISPTDLTLMKHRL